MPIPVLCPGCNTRLNAPDAAAGRNVKCPKCQTLMTIPAKQAASNDFEVLDDEPAPKKPAAPPRKSAPVPAPTKRPAVKSDIVVDDDDEDDRPRKRRRDDYDDDFDDRPRKKKGKKKADGPPPGLLIGGGIAAVLLLGGIAFCIYWFAIREKPADTVAAGTSGGGGDGSKSGPPSGWVQFTPPTGGFKVYFPNAPKFTPTPPTGQIRSPMPVRYAGENEDQMIQCEVQLIYFPQGMSAPDREKFVTDKLDPKKEKLKVTTGINEVGRSSTTLGGVKGTEVVLEIDLKELLKDAPPDLKVDKKGRPVPTKISAVARGIVSGDRGYIVTIITANSRSSDEKAYFDSFELVPETGADPNAGPAPSTGGRKK